MMKQILQPRLGQQLTLTPQLQQAIRLLQLSAQDLTEEIQKGLESNPLLELVDESEEAQAPPPSNDVLPAEVTSATIEAEPEEMPIDIPPELTNEDQSIFEHDWDYPAPQHYNDDTDALFEIKDNRSNSLKERLLWQMRLTPFSELDQTIAVAIIDSIDDAGYLACGLTDIKASLGNLVEDIDLDEIEAVLHRIQHFDPLGVGSRNLQEYLLLQLQQMPTTTPWLSETKTLVNQHIDLLAKRDYKQLKQVSQLKEAQVNAVLKLIQSLNPRPCYEVADSEPQYIIPDVIVHKQQGKWVVELNPACTPKIRVNPHYAALAGRTRGQGKGNCEELRTQLQEARWLVKSLASRNETLYRVARCIVEHQQAFLCKGDVAMKPLILQDIAEKTELHESTVSRITHQKYMQTPVGVYELKHFFSSHLPSHSGEEYSSTAIRALIKKLVAEEPPSKPLSDDKLAGLLLKQQGIKIARRTITKYRESLGISPSNERKNWKVNA